MTPSAPTCSKPRRFRRYRASNMLQLAGVRITWGWAVFAKSCCSSLGGGVQHRATKGSGLGRVCDGAKNRSIFFFFASRSKGLLGARRDTKTRLRFSEKASAALAASRSDIRTVPRLSRHKRTPIPFYGAMIVAMGKYENPFAKCACCIVRCHR